jgi:hypothetical protein
MKGERLFKNSTFFPQEKSIPSCLGLSEHLRQKNWYQPIARPAPHHVFGTVVAIVIESSRDRWKKL